MSDEREYPGADSFLLSGGPEYHEGTAHGEEAIARHRDQRAERGWSDYDWWCGDTYLAHVIGSMALKYRDGSGYPGNMTEEEWHDILTRIAEPLLAYARRKFIGPDEDRLYLEAKKALLLFAEHFGHFWD